jgi:hypothetical protein
MQTYAVYKILYLPPTSPLTPARWSDLPYESLQATAYTTVLPLLEREVDRLLDRRDMSVLLRNLDDTLYVPVFAVVPMGPEADQWSYAIVYYTHRHRLRIEWLH